MREVSLLWVSFFFAAAWGIVLANGARPVESQGAARPASGGVSGRWIVNADFYGSPIYFQLELKEEAGKLSGKFGGDKLEGTVSGSSIHFVAKDEQGGTEERTATVKDGAMSGTIVFTDAGDPEHPQKHAFGASLAPQRRAGATQRHEFTPATFYRQFSAANKPVLTVSPARHRAYDHG